MIIRRKVVKSGKRGVVALPSQFIGEEVVIVTEGDIMRLEDLMLQVLVFHKNRQLDDTEALRRVKMLESKLDATAEELNLRIDELSKTVNELAAKLKK